MRRCYTRLYPLLLRIYSRVIEKVLRRYLGAGRPLRLAHSVNMRASWHSLAVAGICRNSSRSSPSPSPHQFLGALRTLFRIGAQCSSDANLCRNRIRQTTFSHSFTSLSASSSGRPLPILAQQSVHARSHSWRC